MASSENSESESEDNEPADKDQSANSLQGPHNRFVLGYFSSPTEARGMLSAQLPQSLLKVLRMEDLTVENSHFVDESMAEVESDLLFRIPRNDRENTDVYIYVLWEHQRKRDSLMVLRMWIYLGMIYRWLANENRLLPGMKLPFVYPLVLYQSTDGWKKGLVLEDLIDTEGLDEELVRWTPKFEIDLIRLDEDTPRIRPNDQLSRLGLSLMQAIMFQEVAKWLEENIDALNELIEKDRAPVVLILHYALMSGAGLTSEQFMDIVTKKGKTKMRYEAGSVVEEWVKEGEEKGGSKAKKEIGLRLIEKGMSNKEIAEITNLPLNAIAKLRKESEDSEGQS